jgi:hypothetical protein
VLLWAYSICAFESRAQRVRRAVADILRDFSDRRVGFLEQIGCESEPPARQETDRRFADELREPPCEKCARHAELGRDRREVASITTSGTGPASATAAAIANGSFATRTDDNFSPSALLRTITERRR